MNRVTIIGNLTANPESRATNEGKTVCNFTVAVNRRKTRDGQQQEADFFRVAAWNELGASCQKYLSKGKKACVVGPVSVNTYTAQDGSIRASMNVLAQDVEFLSPRDSNGSDGGGSVQPNLTPVNTDGELPF